MVCLSFALLTVVVAMATAQAFGENNQIPNFGGKYFDRKYQNWLMDKRGLGEPEYYGFGRSLGDEDRFFNWRNFFANGISKRQLSTGPGRFGDYRRYFTNGLQDWRNTFNGMRKREADESQMAE